MRRGTRTGFVIALAALVGRYRPRSARNPAAQPPGAVIGVKHNRKEKMMRSNLLVAAGVAAAAYATYALAQYPILDRIAEKAIAKYQNSSCEQLWQAKGQPHSPEEQRAVSVLRSDPQMQQYFLNKVAGPIANKMFTCGMIP